MKGIGKWLTAKNILDILGSLWVVDLENPTKEQTGRLTTASFGAES
jgi:hypothetical protein